MSLTFLSKSSPDRKKFTLLSKALGKELPSHVPQNVAPMGTFKMSFSFWVWAVFGKGFNSKFFFDCHNTAIYIY
jgi:hypothetical protein